MPAYKRISDLPCHTRNTVYRPVGEYNILQPVRVVGNVVPVTRLSKTRACCGQTSACGNYMAMAPTCPRGAPCASRPSATCPSRTDCPRRRPRPLAGIPLLPAGIPLKPRRRYRPGTPLHTPLAQVQYADADDMPAGFEDVDDVDDADGDDAEDIDGDDAEDIDGDDVEDADDYEDDAGEDDYEDDAGEDDYEDDAGEDDYEDDADDSEE